MPDHVNSSTSVWNRTLYLRRANQNDVYNLWTRCRCPLAVFLFQFRICSLHVVLFTNALLFLFEIFTLHFSLHFYMNTKSKTYITCTVSLREFLISFFLSLRPTLLEKITCLNPLINSGACIICSSFVILLITQ